MHRLTLLFQILCKYFLSSSLVQQEMIKNKILQLLALLTPIQPPILISFLNGICIPFKPYIIFHLFEEACLVVS